MKKAALVMLSVTAAFIFLIAGALIGRSSGDNILYIHPEATAPAVDIMDDTRKMDLNALGLEQLMELPGIGQTLAQRILDYKEENGPFASVDELLNVKGIGESRLEQLREYLTVGGN